MKYWMVFFAALSVSLSARTYIATTYTLVPEQDPNSVTVIKLATYAIGSPERDFEYEEERLVLTPDQALRLAITLDDLPIAQAALDKNALFLTEYLVELVNKIEFKLAQCSFQRRVIQGAVCLPVSLIALDKIVRNLYRLEPSYPKSKLNRLLVTVLPYVSSLTIGISSWKLVKKLAMFLSVDIPLVLEYAVSYCDVQDTEDHAALKKVEFLMEKNINDTTMYKKLSTLRNQILSLSSNL